jgi:hypothetical protein
LVLLPLLLLVSATLFSKRNAHSTASALFLAPRITRFARWTPPLLGFSANPSIKCSAAGIYCAPVTGPSSSGNSPESLSLWAVSATLPVALNRESSATSQITRFDAKKDRQPAPIRRISVQTPVLTATITLTTSYVPFPFTFLTFHFRLHFHFSSLSSGSCVCTLVVGSPM